ncbi:MAG: PEP-CTERM-box response regulator transcription factor [Opitutaceae bacterium]|nr:PEP-CTERM-box response regulator transcription factor [Verrucomicrobiales bacterium]
MKPKILIIDDDEEIRTQMKWAIAADYHVALAGDRHDAIERFRVHGAQVVLLDLGLPPSPNDTSEGMATLSALLTLDRFAKIIIISGQSDRENAVRAIGAGAYDFLAKPMDVKQLRLLLQRCVFVSELERDYRQLQDVERPGMFEGILGSNEKMEEVFKTVGKVAKATAPVLILGESGTGKEMIANAIHRRSASGNRPFVAINCNAIPENLIESELFGYEKGAFTGANTQRIGLIETAAGGTLFLDEIGDLPPPMQVKILRFLQEKRIKRVGGRHEIEVDARVLAATHVDLRKAIEEGRFREDLYFRLAVVVCKLPPLRERGDDVILLAEDFLKRFGKQNGRDNLSFEPRALKAILHHPWPGNVRELQNRIQRAVIMADSRWIGCEDLEIASGPDSGEADLVSTVESHHVGGLKEAREAVERELVSQALERKEGNISAAAKELGISRPTLYELMNKLGISKD